MTRVSVVDVGSNSTRLLVCDVQDGAVVAEHDRRSVVTRLAQGVDAAGALAPGAIERVLAAVADFALDGARVAVLTSAVRDAANGAQLVDALRDRFGLRPHVLAGEDEARLTYLGAVAHRADDGPVLVVDIGGGSTELVVGAGAEVREAVSLQLGVVRLSERHVTTDPPDPEELQALAADARAELAARRPRAAADRAIAVAGTPTSLAAIALELEPYDPAQVHGHVLALATVEELLARLAQLPLADRREVTGLHPDRAPTIVAGAVLLAEVLRAHGLEAAEVSEHDLLHGAAIALGAA